MKRIIICTAQVPFERGGAEVLVDGLRRQLAERGHTVDVVALPFKWYPPERLLASCLSWRMLDLAEVNGERVDLVIATKFPSYAVRHPHKVTWLVHQYRQAYDWYGTPLSDLSLDPDLVHLRQSIFEIDRRTLAESERLFAISRNVAGRLERYNGLQATPLYPPTLYEGRLHAGDYGDSIIYIGRLDPAKRVDLLLRAMALAPVGVRCLIAGAGRDRERLETIARRLRLGERVRFLGWVDDESLISLYAGCFAVFYAPLDEDYGYTTVEAFQAAKPVITATDSGGVLEFVQHDESGCVAPPDAAAMAEQITRLYEDRRLCARFGQAGQERVAGIRWNSAIDALLAPG
jgi:glycosyltransferase involved in cell wall biosynthesis